MPEHAAAAHVSIRLWIQPVSVSRIEHCLTHVCEIKNASGQPLQSDRESTVRRHAEIEHPEMAFEVGRFHAARAQCRLDIFTAMQPLAAGWRAIHA